MRLKNFLCVSGIFFSSIAQGQLLNIPTLQVFYGVNPENHLIGVSKHYSNGIGFMGFATIDAGPSAHTDKFFAGPSYTFEDFANRNFSASISPGVWTTGAFYNFPKYPLNYGIATQFNYRLSEKYMVRAGLTFNNEQDFNSGTFGFTYNLGESFFPAKKDSTTKKLNLAITYGGNINGHVFLLETTLSNHLGFHAITLSDKLHPAKGMLDRYYLGPSFSLKEDFLYPFDFTMSLGIYTYGIIYNFPRYPILPASHFKIDYNWKKHIAISTGIIALPNDGIAYSYLGLCYSI